MKTVLQLNSRIKHRHMNSHSPARSQINNEKVDDITLKRIVRQRTNDYVSDNISLVALLSGHSVAHQHFYNIVAKIQFTIKVQPHCSTQQLVHTTSWMWFKYACMYILYICMFSQSYSFTPCATQKKIFISVLHYSVVCCFIICIGLNVYITIVNHDLVDRKYYAKYAWLADCLSIRRIAHSKLIDCKCVV